MERSSEGGGWWVGGFTADGVTIVKAFHIAIPRVKCQTLA